MPSAHVAVTKSELLLVMRKEWNALPAIRSSPSKSLKGFAWSTLAATQIAHYFPMFRSDVHAGKYPVPVFRCCAVRMLPARGMFLFFNHDLMILFLNAPFLFLPMSLLTVSVRRICCATCYHQTTQLSESNMCRQSNQAKENTNREATQQKVSRRSVLLLCIFTSHSGGHPTKTHAVYF